MSKFIQNALVISGIIIFVFGGVSLADIGTLNPTAYADMPGQPGAQDHPQRGGTRAPRQRPQPSQAPGMPGMMPGDAMRQRDGAKTPDEMSAAAADAVKSKLAEVIKWTNAGQDMVDSNIAECRKVLKDATKYFTRFTPGQKTNDHLLTAWTCYYAGDFKKARLAAMQAFQLNKQDINARITLMAMAAANDDPKTLKSALNMAAPANHANREGQVNNAAQQDAQNSVGIVLDFNPGSLIADAMGIKGQSDPNAEIKCLNGTTFKSGNKTFFVLLWTIDSLSAMPDKAAPAGNRPAAQPQMPGMMPGAPGAMPGMMPGMSPAMNSNTPELPPMQAFAALFAKYFGNNNVAFVSLNLDSPELKGKVLSMLMQNAWPWAQAMVADQIDPGFAKALGASAKLPQPMLLAASADGTILYIGSPAGILPRVVARRAANVTASAATTSSTPETKTAAATTTTDSNAPVKSTDANTATPAPSPTPTPPPTPRAQKSDEDTFNPHAQDLYNSAVNYARMPGGIGLSVAVKNCKTILNDYPETPEAEKARALLRTIPPAKRAQYHVTPQDLGE